jgi:hypothetical protein
MSVQGNVKMFTTNDRRCPRHNDDGLRVINNHSGSLHLVPDFSFVQEEHWRRVYTSDLVEVHAIN